MVTTGIIIAEIAWCVNQFEYVKFLKGEGILFGVHELVIVRV
ncbi:hypothetical protein [Bacillus sp. THAF10]|nr:hypothetical protein [Bacillus sp. THAF10]